MHYEWLIGLRYLMGTRSERVPSIITVLSVLAVAVGVTVLILVMSVMGGFEGDLRDKIIGSKAHILLTGQNQDLLDDPELVLEFVLANPDVVGASPFIETELMASSPTNYAGVVLRGIDPARVGSATNLVADIIEGDFTWLADPNLALAALAPERDELRQLRAATEQLLREAEELSEALDRIDAQVSSTRSARMPALPPPGTSGSDYLDGHVTSGGEPRRSPMPGLPVPGTSADAYLSGDSDAGSDVPTVRPDRPTGRRPMPGVIIGAELRESLNIDIGDVLELISPDGPIGPTGPLPSVRRFRVIAIFYTGLYEYDNRMVYALLPVVSDFMRMPPDVVSGVEVKVRSMDRAGAIRERLVNGLHAEGRTDVEGYDWMQLNSSLFAALMLEKVVMGLLLMIIVLVASFAIVCVLIMIVIQKGAEIGILRSMGVSKGGITRIFMVQGAAIGVIGTLIGTVLGVALVLVLDLIGFPLDPEVYYIDRVPVELKWSEVVTVVFGAVGISLLATLYPSMQAARLDPADGLRYE